jgi:kynurenine formamidase
VQKFIDLTKPLNQNTQPYREGDYKDPPFVVSDWCLTKDRGFWVSKLELGTQTGTHIDAPAHFVDGGETLDQLDINTCVGPYFLVRAAECRDRVEFDLLMKRFRGESILLLTCSSSTDSIAVKPFDALLSLGCRLWLTIGTVKVEGTDPLHFHSKLAENGVYLVEDLHETVAPAIRPGGTIIALPMRLEGVSGSPCRVLVSYEEDS